MKIRKNIFEGKEQKVFIYENKKEELILVAIPDINWSIAFTYFEDEVEEKIQQSLEGKVNDEEEQALARRIYQWTREM